MRTPPSPGKGQPRSCGRGQRWAGASCLPSMAARSSMTPSFPVRSTTVTSKKPPEMHTVCSGNTNVTRVFAPPSPFYNNG